MTRWARANNIHKHKPAEATPWSQFRNGGGSGGRGGRDGGAGRGRDSPGSFGGSGGVGSRHRPVGRGRGRGGGGGDPLRHTQARNNGIKKPCRKKKDYDNDDVNGFMEYLQSGGAGLSSGAGRAGMEGLREEVGMALKKDRRREDRRIKRQNDKKSDMLCFKCRKPGHGLADCPEAGRDEEMGMDICYRCGSTEHEIQHCHAKIDPAMGKYPYAKCFICSKTGHLSKSCPDNPKGLYAAGGCCHVCGSVEHFQKDCPEHQDSSNQLTLGWLSNNMSADHEEVDVPMKKAPPKKAKVVVF
ncbi:zinc finger CCHC domain-containing protein 9 [Esox lucius]|uniref:CCHC-type domain-containing protein n=1 Tax=Esox lucius TaxID=8010 RepID=A0A3P8XMT6_ESOLU|nr:zinc finger CCHC domain-containing protein 9 [Esox lucius]XP_010876465.2 zinc finger CCHC domain-containing protein 9 [Esox lucius]XP_010876466.2 zinc finger CCHC domain-containing protein 9 [Esox lucius]